MRIVDLFAGPGGWEEGMRALGLHDDCLGIEWDGAACDTARAAGHDRLQADIALLDPRDFGPVDGLTASPPCQSFSAAGKGLGRQDKPYVIQCAHELAAGFDSRYQYTHLLKDSRSLLTVEPLRWALALKPRWLAFEQVPAVLELWSLFAGLLAEHGYQSATGLLTAEQYGVPQTRKRAYLIASLDGPVSLPAPTHQRYKRGVPAAAGGGLLPWVSMAEALGWGMTRRPSMTVTGGGVATGGAEPFGNGARKSMAKHRESGDWKLVSNQSVGGVGRAERASDERASAEPCVTLSGGPAVGFVQRERSGERFDPHASPCQAITSKARSWTLRQSARSVAPLRAADEPAFTMTAGHDAGDRQWTYSRPCTSICGDPRIMAPGRHDPNVSGSQMKGALRITEAEASILMGFPADYPWQGSRSKQFQQIGNAVAPPMGAVVIGAALAPSLTCVS